MQPSTSEPTPVVPDVTTEDNSWALPRPKATTRQKVLAAALAAACLSLMSFAVGVNVGKTKAPATGGGFGRGGGAGGLPTPGRSDATPAVSTTTTTVDPNLGGLLPGLDVPPEAVAVNPTRRPRTPAPSGS